LEKTLGRNLVANMSSPFEPVAAVFGLSDGTKYKCYHRRQINAHAEEK
jgi:hypothetical protein